MKSIITSLLNAFTKSTGRQSSHADCSVRLEVENLEARELMTVAPVAPMITATGISATQIRLTWSPVASATGYQIVSSVNNGAWATVNLKLTGTQTGVTLTCTKGALYTFEMDAYNSAGYSAWSAASSAITKYNPTATAGEAYSPAPSNAVLYTANGPLPTEVSQGAAGDCWFIASLAATAVRSPQSIKNMFTYEGTTIVDGATVGLYKVRLFNTAGVAHYVTVDTELPAGGTYYDRITNPYSGSTVLWVALAEKAYAEGSALGYVSSNHPGVNSYTDLNGGNPAWALRAITDRPAANYGFSATNLASEWNAGDIIVLTSKSGPVNNPYVDPYNPYIVGDHCYAVIDYKGGNFELLNPWGSTPNGTAPSIGYNGQYVYGMYSFSTSFLAQNFANTALGGAASPLGNQEHAVAPVYVQDVPFHAPASIMSTAEPAAVHSIGAVDSMAGAWETLARHRDSDAPLGWDINHDGNPLKAQIDLFRGQPAVNVQQREMLAGVLFDGVP